MNACNEQVLSTRRGSVTVWITTVRLTLHRDSVLLEIVETGVLRSYKVLWLRKQRTQIRTPAPGDELRREK